ncbi:MAG: 50S ribosomal protein L9 [Termitinemataceae bacterium]|nr:MAG: 50S ribosomal protein L9 [Termitinemataceae bacterium]
MNIKVILNKDIASLGEEGDVKEVARGYARNYLLPRGLAMPHTPKVLEIFEGRRAEIEARKEQKRFDAQSLKEKLESLQLAITMPAGANGKLYGAVTNQTVADELTKQGISIERKRIEIPGNGIKNTGKHKFTVKLYGQASAEVTMTVQAAEVKTETHEPRRRKHESAAVQEDTDSKQTESRVTAGDEPAQIIENAAEAGA